jgi:ADP-heptose:LPS heptosyltransferase
MTKHVSVIIPVFNSEKFLKRCLTSLINQTLKEIEIICIDDGSTDNSLGVLNKYAQIDERIIVLHQKNAKQGAARNKGLEIAQGQFITFVDSDVWVDNDYLEKLYSAAQKHNVNIAAANITREYNHKKIRMHLQLSKNQTFYGASNIVKELALHLETAGKLYKFELIKNLRFEENVLYEDAPYSLQAICLEGSMVTVPDALYHYFSNPNSTIKQKGENIKKENDKISTSLNLISIAEKNNVDIGDWLIIKKENLFTKTKSYKNHKDFYFCGIKIFSKQEKYNNKKIFLVFNTACFGDVLLCNTLCQNIKNIFPNSKVIFIADKNWADIAKYQKDVDEVIIYDKKGEHKGLQGLIKFISTFKYKKIFASFITYKNLRNSLIAKILGSRFVISENQKHKDYSKQLRHALLLESLTNKKIQNLPIKFNIQTNISNPIFEKNYIVICAITKKETKDIPIETIVELIKKINTETNNKVVIVGIGEKISNYVKKLNKEKAKFIDMTNKTSLLELAVVLKNSKGLISADTGTLHLGCALGVPTTAIFYEGNAPVSIWSPSKDLYNVSIIENNQNTENIFNEFIKLKTNQLI